MPLLSDLTELKCLLEIDPRNKAEDKKLLFYMEYASRWIEELLNRPGLFYKQRTEYYRGTGTRKLILKSRPVHTDPVIQVFSDQGGYYGAVSGSFASDTALIYGRDFCLQIDQEDGVSSRCGILLRINGVWTRPFSRQIGYLSPFASQDTGSLKIIYYGGYTVDNLPAQIRLACNMLVARMRYVLPIGMELLSESYEERNISFITERKDYLLSFVKPMIFNYRNWVF